MAEPILLLINQGLWGGMFATGLLFCAIGIRIKEEAVFFQFGVSLQLLLGIAAIDTWILSVETDSKRYIFWTYVQHLTTFICFPAMMLMVRTLSRYSGDKFFSIYLWLSAILFVGLGCDMVFGSGMFLRVSGGPMESGPLYGPLYLPYATAFLGNIFLMLWKMFRHDDISVRRHALLLTSGWIGVGAAGISCVIIVAVSHAENYHYFASIMTWGIASLALTTSWALVHRFQDIVSDRKAIRISLAEMMNSQSDSRIGADPSIITHEVKNYLAVLKGNLKLLRKSKQGTLDEIRLQRAERVLFDLEKMALKPDRVFGRDVGAVGEKISCTELLESCADRIRSIADIAINIEVASNPMDSVGIPVQLEYAFFNIMKNAVEANARQITIKVSELGNGILVSIEDDGIGCTRSAMAALGTFGFSTKLHKGGSGIGFGLAKSIVENCGGTLRISRKSSSFRRKTGMVVEILMPIAPSIS